MVYQSGKGHSNQRITLSFNAATGLMDMSIHLITYIAISTKEVRYELLLHIVNEAAGSLVIFTAIDEELLAGILVYERVDKGPKDRKYPGRTNDQEETHRLRVVGLHHFDNTQQCSDTGPPQMTHTQTLQVHYTRAVTKNTTSKIIS